MVVLGRSYVVMYIHFLAVELLPLWLFYYTQFNSQSVRWFDHQDACLHVMPKSNLTIAETKACLRQQWQGRYADCSVQLDEQKCSAHDFHLKRTTMAAAIIVNSFLMVWFATYLFVGLVHSGASSVGHGEYLSYTYHMEHSRWYKLNLFVVGIGFSMTTVVSVVSVIQAFFGGDVFLQQNKDQLFTDCIQFYALMKLLFPDAPRFDWRSSQFKDLELNRSWYSIVSVESNDDFGKELVRSLWASQCDPPSMERLTAMVTDESQVDEVRNACSTQVAKRTYQLHDRSSVVRFLTWVPHPFFASYTDKWEDEEETLDDGYVACTQ